MNVKLVSIIEPLLSNWSILMKGAFEQFKQMDVSYGEFKNAFDRVDIVGIKT